MKPDFHLLYIGIAPSRSTSRASIRSRVIRNHIRGNTGASTFRLTVASLLFESEGYERVRTTDRVVLVSEDNRRLTLWQEEHLRITWAEHPIPWAIEQEVIEAMKPPLNLAGNQNHQFWSPLSEARRRFRDVDNQFQPTATAITSGEKTRLVKADASVSGRTQRVTAVDLRAGQIRIPSTGTTKHLFPSSKQDIQIQLRGSEVVATWDPRMGPDRERSGVIRLRGGDRDAFLSLVAEDEVLGVTRQENGYITLR